MPSPFPGMDPYLEDPALWPGVHDGLIFTISEELNSILPEGYYSRRQSRLYVVQENKDIIPDVVTFRQDWSPANVQHKGRAALTLDRPSPVVLHVEEEEISEGYVEIYQRSSPDHVVTVIEVLSHTNKAPGTIGYQLYKRKQLEVLASSMNLIEIDLLRRGSHTVAPMQESILREFGPWDYLISLSSARDRSDYVLWLLSIRQKLPIIEVPLLNQDEPVYLDLQAAFDRSYDADRYDRSVRYSEPPYFPLTPDDAAWVDRLLIHKGFRTARSGQESP